MIEQAIEMIAAITSRMAKVPYPTWRQKSAGDVDLAQLFSARLNALRAPGDDAPAVIHVADEKETVARVRELIGDTPEEEIIRQVGNSLAPAKRDYRIGITHCEALIAATGSVIIALPNPEASYASLLVDRHIVIASREQLLPDIADFYSGLSERVSRNESLPNFVCITGCSRTADIEKMLVVPAHGPRQVRVILTA